MAVVFRSKNENITTSSSNPVVTEPSGAASGDFLIALALIDSGSATWTKPTGWTNLSSGTQGAFKWLVSYVVRGGSAPSYTWTKSAGSFYYEVSVLCLNANAGGTCGLDAQSSDGAKGNATGHNPDPPAVTAVASASLAVAVGANWNGSALWGAPAGYTIRTRNSNGDDGPMATKALSASGSENPAAFSNVLTSSNQDYWDGFTVTVYEVTATKSPPPTRRSRRWFRAFGSLLPPAAGLCLPTPYQVATINRSRKKVA